MELGSEFNLSLSSLNITDYHLFDYLKEFKTTIYFDSGRSALKYITRFIPTDGIVLLPEFICESVIRCFDGKRIDFYKIHYDFTIDIENIEECLRKHTNPNVKVIFLMHYFGQVQPGDRLQALKKIAEVHQITMIEDTTHSIFSKKNTIGDYVVSSIRKWMPIPKGGVLYTTKNLPRPAKAEIPVSTENERADGMILKHLFLKGILDCNKEYREIFAACEKVLDKQKNICQLSDFSRFVISCINIKTIISARKENYRFLAEKIGESGLAPACRLGPDDCPFVFPVRVPERDRFRQYLADHKIYCAVHWPFDNTMREARQSAVDNGNSLISLPIDQRYGELEMEYMANVILNDRRFQLC